MVNEPTWVHATADGVSLAITVQPRAKRSEVVGVHGDTLKIRVAAPPVDGAANDALRDFLSKALGVPRRAVALASGASSRSKRFTVDGITVADAVAALDPTP